MSNFEKGKVPGNVMLDESRIYTENGKVKVRHIINESSTIDMTPHPTESRVFVKDGDVVSILSEQIQKDDIMSLEEMSALIKEEIKKIYQMNGNT